MVIRLLLIEDDKIDQMAFERSVKSQKLDYDYSLAGSVAEAKKVVGPGKFDIVIMDYNLGDGTALDVISLIEDIPIIITTGAGDEETAIKVMKAGAYDYLTKDHERNYLKMLPLTVENALKHKKADLQFRMLSYAIMSINESVYITDKNNQIIFVNKSFCGTYGYTEEEILGRNVKIFGGDGLVDESRNINSSGEEGKGWQEGIHHQRKDGNIFPISMSESIIKNEKGKGIAHISVVQDITERKQAEKERESLILELQGALAKIKTLNGLLPICAACKKIRDDQGYWKRIETYIEAHSEAEFTHSICPECEKKLYPE